MADETNIPRWAKSLGPTTWDKINELLREGWDTNDIMGALKIPDVKRRSIQRHARKWGPRRRLEKFERFKDALIQGAVAFAPDFAAALSLVASNAVSPGVKESTQRKACELMTEFTKTITKLMGGDVETEKKRQRAEAGHKEVDPQEVVRKVLHEYGMSL